MGNRSKPTYSPELLKAETEEVTNNFYLNKENTIEASDRIEEVERTIIKPLMRAVRFCIDPVDQVKMLKFIFFVKNLYTCPISLFELCE